MNRLPQVVDDFEHMNPWAQQLFADLARDFRKLYPVEKPGTLPPGVGAPEQLVGQGVEGGLPIGPAEPVGGE